ncbi:MAG: rod shape-determining protein RodA [Planctomycetota bacterium]
MKRIGVWRNFDWVLFAALAALSLIGVLFIWSTNLPTAGSAFPAAALRRQIMWLTISAALFFALLFVDYRVFRHLAYPAYIVALVALLALFVLGTTTRNTRRWFDIAGILSVQPSEFTKLALVLALGRHLMFRGSIRTIRGLLVPAALTFVPVLLILRQPDLATAALLPVALIAMLLAVGANARHLAALLAAACAALVLVLFACYRYDAKTIADKAGIIEPYQVERIQAFLKPDSHPDRSYQYRQSVLAIGSGGLWGKGWGQGTQNRLNFLPERPTDFIFAVIGEERGFLGSAVALALFLVIILRAMAIAKRTREPLGRLLVVGVASVLAAQIFINAAMTVGLVPISGVTLPLVSYGGSSLLATFLGLSLIMNVGMRRVTVLASEDFA